MLLCMCILKNGKTTIQKAEQFKTMCSCDRPAAWILDRSTRLSDSWFFPVGQTPSSSPNNNSIFNHGTNLNNTRQDGLFALPSCGLKVALKRGATGRLNRFVSLPAATWLISISGLPKIGGHSISLFILDFCFVTRANAKHFRTNSKI